MNEYFKQGLEDYKNKVVNMPQGVRGAWYKAKVSTKQWNDFYSKTGDYTFLSGDKNDTFVGFLAVMPPDGCLEINDTDELMKIDAHRRATNHLPFVLTDK